MDAYFKDEKINVGDQIVEQLKENKKIKWIFTTTQDANLGIMDGTYYAIIEIPSGFSGKLLTLLSGSPQKPQIIYKVDTKANPVASKITSSANNTLIRQVTGEFVDTVNETVFGYINQMGETADIETAIADLEKLKTDLNELRAALVKIHTDLSTLHTDIDDLYDALEKDAPALKAAIHNLDDTLENAISDLTVLNQKAIAALQTMKDANIGDSLSDLLERIISDRADVDAFLTSMSESITSAIAQTDSAISKVDEAIDGLEKIEATNTNVRKVQLGNMVNDLNAIKPYIADEQNQLAAIRSELISANGILESTADLVNADCNKIASQMDSARELIKTTQDLSVQIEGMVKTAKEGNDLSAEFSMDLYNKLQEFKDVILIFWYTLF